MKIFHDGAVFLNKAQGDINNLFVEIISRLPAGANKTEIYLHRFPETFDKTFLKREYFALPAIGNALMLYDCLILKRKISKFQPDIYHTTYYRIPENTGCLNVITVCEMEREIYPDGPLSPQGKEFLKMKRNGIEKADRIIAVSGSVRRDITRIYGIDPEKISVVYPGISEIFKPATDIEKQLFVSKYNLSLNFILYSGQRSGHKNFEVLLRAFSKWGHRDEFELICVGPQWDDYEIEMINSLKLSPNVRLINFTESNGLKIFYSLASVFIYPSKYESFGAPLLEAMACGTPIIAASSSSIPETAANAAQYFEPDSADELIAALDRVTEDEKLRRGMREKGLKRSSSFSWNNTARETYEVYQKLMHG